MDKLIKRNNVINYLRNEVSLGTFMKRTVGKADEACWSICNGIITKVPTVDAEPVRHGKWTRENNYGNWKCSVCGCKVNRANPLKGNIWNYYYCPNCGARMDEEDSY